jgi:hypothetical protein
MHRSLTIQSAVLCLRSYLRVSSSTVNKCKDLQSTQTLSWSTTWAPGPWTISFQTGGVFLPYHTHLGGTASVFGLFGVLQIQLLQTWKTHAKPCSELSLLFAFFTVYIFLGLLPMVDNYEHIGGYWAGLLLGSCLLPYVTFGSWNIRVRRLVFALSLSFLIMTILFLVFCCFVDPEFNLPNGLVYFSCLPFSSDYCESFDVELQ